MAITLWYWKIPGRASLAYVLLKVGGLDVKYIDDDEQEVKESYWTKSPFGQLPYLIDEKNGVEMAQSAAIVGYAARLAKLDGGDNLVHYSQTLMYLELEAELCGFIGKALYTGENSSEARSNAWIDAKKKVVEKLERVKSNLGDKKYIGATDSPLAADYSIATMFWLMSQPSLWPSLKDEFPTLNSHFNRLCTSSPIAKICYQEMDTWEAYYKI